MTNNQLTKEWLQQTIAELESVRDEIPFGIDTNSELELTAFKMALAAMDSEPVAWGNGCDKTVPAALRYLAENERPIGGESSFNTAHLYQLAREIELMAEAPLYRYAQPAPRNPVGVINGAREPVLYGEHIGIAIGTHLYAEPQPAPVVPTFDEWLEIRGNKPLGWVKDAMRESYDACRAAILQPLHTIKAVSALGSLPKTGEVLHTNSPVIPDGYVMVPMRLTAENGAKGALSGEFSETKFVNCPECFGDDECETCDGSGRIEIKVPVSWTTIKEIWIKSVEHFAAAPQENN